jgi:hypothetical protein
MLQHWRRRTRCAGECASSARRGLAADDVCPAPTNLSFFFISFALVILRRVQSWLRSVRCFDIRGVGEAEAYRCEGVKVKNVEHMPDELHQNHKVRLCFPLSECQNFKLGHLKYSLRSSTSILRLQCAFSSTATALQSVIVHDAAAAPLLNRANHRAHRGSRHNGYPPSPHITQKRKKKRSKSAVRSGSWDRSECPGS